MKRLTLCGLALGLTLLATLAPLPATTGTALAQQFDYGDAPEDAVAYPGGTIGKFPTCLGGSVGYIRHANAANGPLSFGPLVDAENDGNGGVCIWPGYQGDECWQPLDDDAGIVLPTTWDVVGGLPVACSPLPHSSLGPPCGKGDWGVNLEFGVRNLTGIPAYFNAVVDWNQDGRWGGTQACPNGPVSERLVTNVVIPPGYVGPVSALGLTSYRVGANAGFVWMRVTLTDVPIVGAWDGSGQVVTYNVGETEDYLLLVGSVADHPAEFGDAPEGALAYPPTGVAGDFPTATSVGAAGTFVVHTNPVPQLRLGPSMDTELDGNDNDPLWSDYDRDECNLLNGDAGFVGASVHTIVNGLIEACGNSGSTPLGDPCSVSSWGVNGDIFLVNQTAAPAFLNVLGDWNRNGRWSGNAACNAGGPAPEWALQNFIVPPGYVGLLSVLNPPPYRTGREGFAWLRFTLSDAPVTMADWDGSGVFDAGETEDYLVYVGNVSAVPDDAAALGGALRLEAVTPNPFQGATTVAWWQAGDAPTRVTVHDLQGRLVTTLAEGNRAAGRHALAWDGRDAAGRATGAGLYLVRVQAGAQVVTRKLVRSR